LATIGFPALSSTSKLIGLFEMYGSCTIQGITATLSYEKEETNYPGTEILIFTTKSSFKSSAWRLGEQKYLGVLILLDTEQNSSREASRYFSMHHRTSLPPKKFIVKSHIPFCNEATYLRKLYQSLMLNYLQIHHNCSTGFARR